MTPDERFAALKELLPGLKDVVYEALIAEHSIGSLQGNYQIDLVEPLRDLMVRLRFNDAKKLRVANYCGTAGASFLGNAYWSFKMVMNGKERADMTVALQVLTNTDMSDGNETEAAVGVVNELNDKDGDGPVLEFNLPRALLAVQSERLLKRIGRITPSTPIDTGVMLVWQLVKRAERRPGYSLEELMGLTKPRSNQPNVMFSDGRFGDGTRLETVTLADGTTVQRRTSRIEPLVPSFVGLSPMEIQLAIQEMVKAKAKAKAQL